MFKRPRLRPVCPLVNVGLAASFIFISACSGDPEPIAPETQVEPTANSSVIEQNPARLQAVWNTSSLSSPIRDLGLSGGNNPVLASVLDGGQLQLFDLDGVQLTEPTDVGITAIGDGFPTTLNELAITMFPGIGPDGSVNMYLYSQVIGTPVAVDLIPEANAAGLCVGASASDGALAEIAYWSPEAPSRLITGHVSVVDDELQWTAGETKETGKPPSACRIGGGVYDWTDTGTDLAVIKNGTAEKHLVLSQSGVHEFVDGVNDSPITIRDGISVQVPEPIIAMSALSDVQFGGYPQGVIIVGGPVNGAPKLVFIEPIALFDDGPE